MLQADGECRQCTDNKISFDAACDSFGLNTSQSDVVKSYISTIKCPHRSSAWLIWGPPGIGKTKVVSVILHMLLLLMPWEPRILVCAPTNTAILQLASRLVSLFENSSTSKYSINDITLSRNEDRMKLKAGNEVWSNIFVNNRVTLENSKRKCIEDARLVF